MSKARFPLHADRDFAGQRHSAHDPVLIAVIVDRDMLRRAIVPDDDVTDRPAPTDRILQLRDVRLENLEQTRRLRGGHAQYSFDETAEQERFFTGKGMNANDGMLGFIDG